MSKYTLDPVAVQHTLTIRVEPDVVKSMIESEYEKIKGTLNVKGFRKGNAPRDAAEAQSWFDKFSYYRNVIMDVLRNGIREHGLQVLDYEELSIMGEFSDKTPLVVRCKVHLVPKVLKFDIKDVTVEAPKSDVTADDLEKELASMLKAKQVFNSTEDPEYQPKLNDMLIIDFFGTIDKVPFKGGKADNFKYIIGETNFIPGFQDQMLNLRFGQSGVVTVKFPDDYHNAELKGKEASFDVKIKAIHSCTRPTVADLASNDGKSEAEFRDSVNQKLKDDAEKVSAEQLRRLIIMKCLNVAETEPMPEILINSELETDWAATLNKMGMTEDQVKKSGMMSKEQFFHSKRRDAEVLVKSKVVFSYIADQEKLDVTDEDLKQYAEKRIKEMGRESEMAELLKHNLEDEANKSMILNSLKQERAMDWVISHATLLEG